MVMAMITVTRTGDHSKSGDVYDDISRGRKGKIIWW